MKKNNFLSRLLFLSSIIFLFLPGCNKTSTHDNSTQVISIKPMNAASGDTVTLYGRNLPVDNSSIKITVNEKPLPIIMAARDSLKFTIPESVGSGEVVVTSSGQTYKGPEFTYDWKVIVTTIAGTGQVGNSDGAPEQASFYCPWGIVSDANGDLYIADVYNRLIRKITASNNNVSTFPIGSLNFASPYNLTIDTNTHNLYVTDFNKNVMKMTADGNASVIFVDSMPLAGIALSPDKNLFIGNNTLGTITKIDTNGQNRTIFASGLLTPRNIFFDAGGLMYVSAYSGSLSSPVVNKIDNAGNISVAASDHYSQAWEVVMNGNGEFFEADHFNNVIRRVDKNNKSTIIAGNGIAEDIDGIGVLASFNGPQGIAIDSKGDLYVTTFNYDNNSGNKIRKIYFQ